MRLFESHKKAKIALQLLLFYSFEISVLQPDATLNWQKKKFQKKNSTYEPFWRGKFLGFWLSLANTSKWRTYNSGHHMTYKIFFYNIYCKFVREWTQQSFVSSHKKPNLALTNAIFLCHNRSKRRWKGIWRFREGVCGGFWSSWWNKTSLKLEQEFWMFAARPRT